MRTLAGWPDFRVGGGIVGLGYFIDTPAYDFSVLHNDGGERSAVTANHVLCGHFDRLFQPVVMVHIGPPFRFDRD